MSEGVTNVAGLSTRAKKVLALLGVTTKDELNQFTEANMAAMTKIRGCGRETLYELLEWSGYREIRKLEVIAKKCDQAHLFLESRGYTVIAPDKPTFYVQMAGRGNRAKAIQEKGGAE